MAKIIPPTRDSEGTGSPDPIWIDLAYYLAGYTKCKYKCAAFRGNVPSFGPAAIIKIWSEPKEAEKILIDIKDSTRRQQLTRQRNDAFLKSTIAITADIAFCTDCDHGIKEIELANPKACEMIVAWMVKVGVAPKKSKWVDPI